MYRGEGRTLFMGNGVLRGEGYRGVTVDTLVGRNAHDMMCITWWLQIVDRALVAMAAESDCGLHGNAIVPFMQQLLMGDKVESKGCFLYDRLSMAPQCPNNLPAPCEMI